MEHPSEKMAKDDATQNAKSGPVAERDEKKGEGVGEGQRGEERGEDPALWVRWVPATDMAGDEQQAGDHPLARERDKKAPTSRKRMKELGLLIFLHDVTLSVMNMHQNRPS